LTITSTRGALKKFILQRAPEIFPAKMPEIFLIEREGRA
jgi:hypothetical protein